MLTYQEHLFISQQIPGLEHPEVLGALQPTVDDLRDYFDKRQGLITQLGSGGSTDDINAVLGFDIYDMELRIQGEPAGDTAVILRTGDVLMGQWLTLHLMDTSEPGDFVLEPRNQLKRLATELAEMGVAEEYPVLVATTYPKLARAAHLLVGMEYAAATYFPATYMASSTVKEIFELEDSYLAKNKLPIRTGSQLESLVIPTQAFLERFAD